MVKEALYRGGTSYMIASLVIALREGIEAALVVGIVLAYLTKVGRKGLRRVVYVALATAVCASISLAAVFELAGLNPDNPYMEGVILGIAGLFVVSMVAWMWKASQGLKARMEGRLETITSEGSGKAIGWGLFGFTFVMVLREGVETVLFLKAAALGSEASVAAFAGALVGLGLAIAFAVLFIRGSVRVNLPRFFRYTSLALLVLAVKLLLGSAYEFSELGLFPLGNGFVEKVGEVTTGTAGAIITSAVIAVPVLLLLWETSAGLRRRLSHAV
jgi:high-affinity iron transporter